MPGRWAESYSQPFLGHYESLRGVVRQMLVARQLDVHLTEPPGRVIDVGAGDGHQGIRLARLGFEVVLVDPSPTMIEAARGMITNESSAIRQRVEILRAGIGDVSSLMEGRTFDVVLCHGVVLYLDASTRAIQELAALTHSGGLVSLVAKNAAALAMRPALQGRWADALDVFDATEDIGGLGVATRGDTLDELSETFDRAGLELLNWYGLRILTDHLSTTPPGPDQSTVLEVEWRASTTDPYRAVARLLHLVGRKR